MEKIFSSYDKLHEIRINIINEECWFNIEMFNEYNCKTFLLLVKEVLEYINSNNIKIIKQYIFSDDCKYFEKSIIEKYEINTNTKKENDSNKNNIFIVTTKIEDFVEELVNVLDIKRL